MTAQISQNKPPLDTGLAGLVLLLRVLGVAAEYEGLRHKFGPPSELADEAEAETPTDGMKMMSVQDLLHAAKSVKVKARHVRADWNKLVKLHLPALAFREDGSAFIIARLNEEEDKILIQDPSQQQPETITRDALEAIWSGHLMLITKRAGLGAEALKFDISWFVPALLKYKKLFLDVLLASFFLQLFGLVTPLFFQVVIDKVLVNHALTTLNVLMVGLICLTIFEAIIGYLRTYLFSHTTQRVDVALGARLFNHLLGLPMGYFEARQVGQSVARVRELETIRNFITGSALTVVIDLFFTLVFFAVLWFYSSILCLIVMASVPLYVILSVLITPILRKRVEEKFQRGAINQAFLVESITGVETIKAMAVEPQMQRRWEEQLAGYVKASFKAQNLNNAASNTAQFISKITTALVLFFGANLVIAGSLTVGQLVAFNMIAGRITMPVLRLAQLWQDFQQARISVERLGDILNTPIEPSNAARATLPPINGHIQFERVNFRYTTDGPEILKNVNLDIPAGQIIGIVGPSGSGKSTIAKLIQRLHIPEAGRILVDGIDLAMADPAWLRRQMGVVLQENILFDRSIRENIALADPGMPMDRVIEAAKKAGAHEFILETPFGYDTKVGERGSNLSGGQRQRVAIARAIVTNPRILVFDEATSALDYESEAAIQANMREICQSRTVVIVAHRLAAVRLCDRIITVEKGQITEDGTQEELLKKGGRFAKLYHLQSAGLPEEKMEAAE